MKKDSIIAELESAFMHKSKISKHFEELMKNKEAWKYYQEKGKEMLREINRWLLDTKAYLRMAGYEKISMEDELKAMYFLQGGHAWLGKFLDMPAIEIKEIEEIEKQLKNLKKEGR